MSEHAPDVTAIPADARRLLVAGELWWVYEDPRIEPPYLGPALVFKGDRVARRVRVYPGNWRGLTDEQLYALSWSR